MKKLFVALLAATVLAAPMTASADQFRHNNRIEKHRDVRIDKRVDKKVIVHKHRWAKGKKLSRSDRRQIVNTRDYRRYNLRQPRRGEQWVRVDNQFLLISAATGLILGLTAAR